VSYGANQVDLKIYRFYLIPLSYQTLKLTIKNLYGIQQRILQKNLEEYKNPEAYDLNNTWGQDDDFYLELAINSKGKVLDLACGTGRLTMAINKSDIEVTGLDITPEMLQLAKTKSEGLNINWVEGDCRSFDLAETFDLILMTSHGFQYLMTAQDQTDFLKSVKKHLNKNGLLAFETRNPQKMEYGSLGRSTKGEFKYMSTISNSKNEKMKQYFSTTFYKKTQLDHIIFKNEK